MRVETLGRAPADYTIVSGIHGDERAGVRAIERFLDDPPQCRKGIKFLIAHEGALEKGVRQIEYDLNRAFADSGNTLEHKLAEQIKDEIGESRVLDLHSTESFDEPFLMLQNLNETKRELAQTTGISRAVDASALDDALIGWADGVSVETGRQGTETAAENAYEIINRFLTANGVIDGPSHALSNPTVYTIRDLPDGRISKPAAPEESYEILATNFQLVEVGDEFARVGDSSLYAEEDFYPVLMSETGYGDIFGFRADISGPLFENRSHRIVRAPALH